MEDEKNEIEMLSNTRKNIISWYPFEPNATLLEINADSKQITEELKKKIKNVTIIESSEIENISERFDYITIIGIENIEDIQQILKNVKRLLNQNGKLLIAMNNKYSIKNLSTKSGIDKILNNNNREYTLNQILDMLQQEGFDNTKTYYPLTDYKFTNVIFTDKKILKSELSRNIVYNSEDEIKFFEENDLMDKLLEDNIEFKNFTNSYFIEVFNGEYIDNEIRLVTFANMRKDEYKIITIMKNDFIYKYPDNEKSKKHIENVKKNIDIMLNSKLKTIDSYDDEKIISKYVENDTFDRIILNTVKKESKDKALELIKKFEQTLLDNLEEGSKENNVFDRYEIEYEKDIINNMKFAKYGLWDLIFQNCFYIDNDFYFYDQEWMEENIPIKFILYRAVKYFTKIRKYISIEELYEYLNIDEKELEIFEKLDDKIQEKSRNDNIWKIQKNGKNIEELRIQKLTDNHTINLLNNEIQNKNNEIAELKKVYENTQNKIDFIYQSKSWKIAEKLRKIRQMFK